MTSNIHALSRLSLAAVAVLEHLRRYRVGTNASIQADLFPHITLNAVTKITAALVRRGVLNRFPLCPPHYYFTLGPQGVRYFGISRRRVQPLGPQALPTQFGALYFCVLGETRRPRLTPHELRREFPWMPAAQCDAPYYLDIDDTGTSRLALIRTDTGGAPDYLARRCEHDLAKRRASTPEFARLIDSGQFLVTFIVPTADKANALASALASRSWSVKFRLAICAELLPLLARLPHGT